MAGITNAAFRQLCREAWAETGYGGPGVLVSEMVTSRALVERTPVSLQLIEHGAGGVPAQRPAVRRRPGHGRAAVRMLVEEDRADHVDLNFGCPVPKVTRKGGGAALPWKTGLFRAIVAAAVERPSRPACRSPSRCGSASTPTT